MATPMSPGLDCATPVVELGAVVREYVVGGQRIAALNGIDLALHPGDVTAVVGPSGSGKSTLLHVLGALDAPTSGSVRLNGTDVTGLSEKQQSDFRLHNIGFVFQSFNLLPTLSAWENVALPRLFAGKSIRSAKGDAIRLLEDIGLGNRIDHRPSQLSGGQMQRVAVARALVMNPSIVLADEPTGNLDSKTGGEVIALLRNVVESGATSLLVMVTHDTSLASSLADRIITIRDGSIESELRQAKPA